MSPTELHDLFESFNDDFLKFERIESKRSSRADLHAFMLLDALVPGAQDIVSGAEHDEIWLGVSADDLAAVATPEIVLELVRCGVRHDEDTDSLAMFA